MRGGPFRQKKSFDNAFGEIGATGILEDNEFPSFGNEIESTPADKSQLPIPPSSRTSADSLADNPGDSTAINRSTAASSGTSSSAMDGDATKFPSKVAAGATQTAKTSNASKTAAADLTTLQETSSAGSNQAATLGVDGKPLATQATEIAQTSTPVRPMVPVENAFDISSINPLWWAVVPAVILLGAMFHFLMGTSSSDEMARYKYRGPKVEDPDASDVRGRFKKRTPVGAESVDPDSKSHVVTAPSDVLDDDLGFLDDMPESDSVKSSPDLSGDAPQVVPDVVVSDSSESNPVNPTDSEDDFDFFDDDDTGLSSDGQAAATVGGREEFDLTQPEAIAEEAQDVASDAEMDFFDDSDDEFSFDDDEIETPAVAAAPVDTELAPSAGQQSDEQDAQQSDVFDTELVDEEAEDKLLEPAVVAASTATVAAVASTKGASWFGRLFKGRKAKKAQTAHSDEDEILESDSIAAVAVENPGDVVVPGAAADFQTNDTTEDSSLVEAEDDFSAEASDLGAGISDSGELSFSDSDDSFSLDDGDESSTDLFDDDSDAGYEFEPSDEPAPAVEGADAVAEQPAIGIASTNDEDGDFDAMWSDDEDELELSSAGDQQASPETPDPIAIFEEPEPHSETIAFTGPSDPSSEPVSEAIADQANATDTNLAAASIEEAGSEFDAVPPIFGHDELPLLEDQLLDDIVESEQDAFAEDDSQLDVGPVVAGSIAAAGMSGLAEARLDSDITSADANPSAASDEQLSELHARIAELESSNASLESQQLSLKEELLNQQQAKQQAEADAETAAQDIAAAQQAAAEANAAAEQAAVDLKTALEKAESELAAAKEETQAALAAKAELESAAQQKEQALGGSLMAAAAGAVAGATVASATGDPQANASDADDPFRLEPDQVKVMLKKLKTERKKRLKTKEHFLAADAKRREVAATLRKVTGQLQSLKVEFSQLANGADGEVSSDLVAELKQKLDSAEDALKNNNASQAPDSAKRG